MAEQSGPSVAALQAKQAALSARHSTAADADHVLAEAALGAHSATVAARKRLDAIVAEIDDCVRHQAALALDTPLGAREFRKFLIVKHRELITIVAEAHGDDAAKQAVLESLRPQYSDSASPS
jgi:predicted RNA methylase